MKRDDIARLSIAEKRELLSAILAKKAALPEYAAASANVRNQFAVCVEDLKPEVVLDPAIQPAANVASASANPAVARILLTGATGFLGAFLLHELLENSDSEIWCLVRCSSAEAGRIRLEQNYREYLGPAEFPSRRVKLIRGDLASPRLGLSTDEFESLAATIDTIFHSGAHVNWLYPYTKLKPANVLGTQEILRLACHGKTKPVHFVSTLAVFPLWADAATAVLCEEASLDHGGILYGGYCQSKWVAEMIAGIAQSRGLPVVIYRPGLICGDSRTGASNSEDVLGKMLRSWIAAGSAPEVDAGNNMTPVDYVSRAIVYLSESPQSFGKAFHLVNSKPVRVPTIAAAIRSLGINFRQIPYAEWRSKMVALTNAGEKGPLSSLAPFFEDKPAPDICDKPRPYADWQSENVLDTLGILCTTQPAQFDSRRTLEALTGSSIACPEVNVEVLKKYFSNFARKGLLAGQRGRPAL